MSPAASPAVAEALRELSTGLVASPRARLEVLHRHRDTWAGDPALGPLILRLLGLDLLEVVRDEDGAAGEMVRAAELEERQGWLLAASHTRHQLALMTASRGRLAPVVRYYRESLDSLRERHNRRALGLGYRSLGELALRAGRRDSTLVCWQRAADALRGEDVPESEGPDAWLGWIDAMDLGVPE